MSFPRVSHLSDNRQIANAINQALKLGESAGTGGGTGTVTTTGTPASGNLAKFSGTTSITNADLTGDVTTSGALATTIASGAVTLAKMANMATASLIYRKTAGSGAPEVNSLATLKTDLGLSGTNSGDQTITLTGDVTGSGTGSFAATLATSGVSAGTYTNATVTFDAKGRATSASSGSAGAWTLISTTTLAVATGTVSFSSIPATYKDLVIIGQARSSLAATSDPVRCQLNGDTAANYDFERENRFGVSQGNAIAYIEVASIAGSTAPASVADTFEIAIPNYAATVFHKMVRSIGEIMVSTAAGGIFRSITSGRWRSTAAVTQVTLFSPASNFVIGSTFSLYGRS